MGAQITVSGQGFVPNEAIFLEIFPVGAPETRRIGNISASATGTFSVVAEVGIAYAGPDVPTVAPVGGGQKINHPPGDYQIMAYPVSFGGRTADTIARAPKVPFTVTASGLPATGGSPGSDRFRYSSATLFGLVLVIAGLATWAVYGTRRSRG